MQVRNHFLYPRKATNAKTTSLTPSYSTVRVTQPTPETYALRPVIFMTALPAGKDIGAVWFPKNLMATGW